MSLATSAEVDIVLTGRARWVNGVTEVPRPLFGVHATPLTAAQRDAWGVESVRVIQHEPGRPAPLPENGIPHLVECFFDRFQPALIVQYADWEQRLRNLARQYAEAARSLDREAVVEFWNEPYLNWGVRPGVNYDGAFYREEGRAIGAPMTLRYETTPSPYLVWTRARVAVWVDKGTVDYVASRFMPPNVPVGGEFTWRDRQFRVEERWWGQDTTQHTFWPGRQNVEWYNRMLRVFAEALKEVHPRVTLIGGWDFHVHQNNYEAWADVHRPTLDAAAPWLDGYTEHHYGGDTRAVAASYETVVAWMQVRHGRRIRVWNTEAGGELDPEQPGIARSGYNTLKGEARERGGLTYMARDLVHLLDALPDKAAARAAHEAHTNRGVIAAFQLFKPLRGRLMEAVAGQPDVWVASALDGAQWALVVYNDGRESKSCRIRIQPPARARIGDIEEWSAGTSFEIAQRPLTVERESTSDAVQIALQLEPREMKTVVMRLNGTPQPRTIEEHQYFSAAIVEPLHSGEEKTWDVALDAAVLQRAERAAVRLCVRGWHPALHELAINDQRIAPDPVRSGIQDLDVPVSALSPKTRLRIRAAAGAPQALIENLSIRLIAEAVEPR